MERSALKRGTKPLQRKARLKARKSGSLFPKRRDDTDGQYAAWIRTQSCIIRDREARTETWPPVHRCLGATQACHVRSRGAAGFDLGNLYPGCIIAHHQQHLIGIRSFQARWSISLADEAKKLYARYLEETT